MKRNILTIMALLAFCSFGIAQQLNVDVDYFEPKCQYMEVANSCLGGDINITADVSQGFSTQVTVGVWAVFDISRNGTLLRDDVVQSLGGWTIGANWTGQLSDLTYQLNAGFFESQGLGSGSYFVELVELQYRFDPGKCFVNIQTSIQDVPRPTNKVNCYLYNVTNLSENVFCGKSYSCPEARLRESSTFPPDNYVYLDIEGGSNSLSILWRITRPNGTVYYRNGGLKQGIPCSVRSETLQEPPAQFSVRIRDNKANCVLYLDYAVLRVCKEVAEGFETTSGSDLGTNAFKEGIETYPNPASHFVKVKLGDRSAKEIITMDLVDNRGRLIENIEITGETDYTILTDNLNEGIYYLRARTKSGETFVEKIILNSLNVSD